MEDNHTQSKLLELLKKSRPWMGITSVSGIFFILFTLYRFSKDRYFMHDEVESLIWILIGLVFIARYILLWFTQRALNNRTDRSDKEKLDVYYARTSAYWMFEGILSLILTVLFLYVVLDEYRYI